MGQLAILDGTGDSKVIWDPANEAEVETARDMFNKLTKKGHHAFAVKRDGEKGERVTAFDPTAAKLILIPQLVGGAR